MEKCESFLLLTYHKTDHVSLDAAESFSFSIFLWRSIEFLSQSYFQFFDYFFCWNTNVQHIWYALNQINQKVNGSNLSYYYSQRIGDKLYTFLTSKLVHYQVFHLEILQFFFQISLFHIHKYIPTNFFSN